MPACRDIHDSRQNQEMHFKRKIQPPCPDGMEADENCTTRIMTDYAGWRRTRRIDCLTAQRKKSG